MRLRRHVFEFFSGPLLQAGAALDSTPSEPQRAAHSSRRQADVRRNARDERGFAIDRKSPGTMT